MSFLVFPQDPHLAGFDRQIKLDDIGSAADDSQFQKTARSVPAMYHKAMYHNAMNYEAVSHTPMATR